MEDPADNDNAGDESKQSRSVVGQSINVPNAETLASMEKIQEHALEFAEERDEKP